MWAYTVPKVAKRPDARPALRDVLANRKKYHYGNLDLMLMRDLMFRRFMRTDQIHREYFAPASLWVAQRRLNKLYQRHFINRWRPPAEKGQGSEGYVYFLDWLGWDLLRYEDGKRQETGDPNWQPLNIGRRWRPPEKLPIARAIAHDLELNDLCMDLRDFLQARGLEVVWLTTRQAQQTVPAAVAGQAPATYNPDAVFVVTGGQKSVVLHLEYERSAELAQFRHKIPIWERYRQQRLWERQYPAMPIVVVVGNREDRRENDQYSVVPLRDYIRERRIPGVFFLYLDEGYWSKDPGEPFKWEVEAGATGERSPICAPAETSLWDQVKV